MNLQEARKRIPELDGLNDDSALSVIQQVYYPDMDRAALAGALGVKIAAPPAPERTWGQAAGDYGISLLKGAIAVPEAAVGLADIPTGGRVGKALEEVGFRPGDAKSFLSEGYSDQQKKAFQSVQQAEGFGGKLAAALESPSVIAHTIAESAPSMLAGGAVGRGVMALAPRVGAAGAAALGEGVVGAGSAAEQIRQETPGGLMTATQSGLAALSGVGTAAFSALGSRVARSMGIADIDTMLVGAASNPVAAKSVVRRVLEGAVSEGVLEELPQSIQEQVLQNAALGKDLSEGVDHAAVMGLLSGAAMGGGANVMSGSKNPAPVAPNPAQSAADAIRATESVPESGALGRAVNAGVEAKAQAVEAGAPLLDEQAAAEPTPEPVDDPVRDQILALPEGARQDALRAYAVVNRTDVAKGVQQYNRKLLDRLLAENAPPPVLGERLTDTSMDSMLGGGGMAGRADPLAGATGMNREAQANTIDNISAMAERRPPMPASDAVRMLDEARNQGVDLAVAEHPAGGFVLVPPAWITPDVAAQGEQRLNETIGRMQQADAAPVERAARSRTDAVDLSLNTDPVQNYVDGLRQVNTPAARAFVRDVDAGRITPAQVQQRMTAERGKTPDERIAQAAAEAPAPIDTVANRLAVAAEQGSRAVMPADILNPLGLPFKTLMSAKLAAKRSPGEVVPVEGGFVVRPQEVVDVQDAPQGAVGPLTNEGTNPEAAPVEALAPVAEQPTAPTAGVPAEGVGAVEAAGVKEGAARAAGDEQPFAQETGTLGIPRAEMPQVPTQSHGGLVRHLNAQGIAHETTMVDAADLKPTQAEFSPSKVAQAKEATGDRAVIVSNDGHIIDGHHQALAAAEDGKPVKAIVLDAPVEQALEAVKASPSARKQATPDQRAEDAQADSDERATRDRVELDAKVQDSADDFELGQDANDALAGQKPMFSRKAVTDSKAFRDWFGDSKVVDAEGSPLVVYHGTRRDVKAFDRETIGSQTDGGFLGDGFYFTDAKRAASAYAKGEGGNVIPAYLSIKNPYYADGLLPDSLTAASLQASGYDGVIYETNGSGDYSEYVAFRPEQIKSATGNRGTFDPKNPDIRFSFAGARAKTADMHALVTAQDRLAAGDDAETVRRETGWHKGIDGRMRFEISDNEATLSLSTGKVAEAVEFLGGVTVGDVIDHPKLFAAYPSLANTPIEMKDGKGASLATASINGVDQGKTILMGRAIPQDQFLSVLLHEIQHGIQDIEGFATGGSPDAMMIARLGKKEQQEYEKALAALPDDATEAQVKELRSRVYRRLAGEVEARNTQARRKFSDAARRGSPPSRTADVADSDVIVTFNGKDMASAPQPANATQAGVNAPKSPADSDERNAAAQKLVDALSDKWTNKPAEIIVARNMQDEQIPQRVRDYDAELKSQGADGEARGFIYRGKVYLLSDELNGPSDIAEVLFHEVLGHYGLRRVFGDGLDPILGQIAALRRKEVLAKAREYGMVDRALGNDEAWAAMSANQRLQAAEEVLAEMAQTQPELGYVKRAIAAVRNWLRANLPGFAGMKLTDADIVQAYILPARGWVERGQAVGKSPAARRESFKPAFSIGKDAGQKALAEFAKADELFALPKSTKDTVEGIAADVASEVKVRVTRLPGETMYTLSHPDMGVARITERSGNPYGPSLYGYNLVDGEMADKITERPGENPEDVDPRTGDVWLDVSLLKPGNGGVKMYAIASNYAHNTGKIFIGDPAGLSTVALRRRLEQMLSSALKFGTTAHLAPHPDQVRGGNGVPPLRWVYGDDVGNVERMIAASVKALDNAMPTSKKIAYDPDRGFYRTDTGSSLARGQLAAVVGRPAAKHRVAYGDGATGQAGWRTIARAALLRHATAAAADSGGRPGATLEVLGLQLSRLESDGSTGPVGSDQERDSRIFYSRAPRDGVNAGGQAADTTPEPDRSTAAGVAVRLGDAIKSVTVQNVKNAASYKKSDWLGLGLQALGRRQIVDIYGKDLPQLSEYNKLAAQMEADKNEVGAEADQLAQRWGKLKDEKALAELMHDATLAQVDPDKAYVEGDDKSQFQMLKRRFATLSDEARAVYRDARGAYEDHHAKVREAIKQRIMRSELKGGARADLLKKMDDEFFEKAKGVYFPLARFGQYVVAVKGPDGKIASVNRAETMAEAQALRDQLVRAFPPSSGHTVVRPTLSKEFIANRDAVGRGFMTELYGVLDGMDMDTAARLELEDTLGQLYLSSLPDLSWAKHGIHRKGTPGFSQDARRAFAQNMFHGGRYLAKLRYSDLMQDQITDMQKTADDWKEVGDYDQPSAQRVVDEMQKRHEAFMNPKSNPLSTALTSLGFVFHLGLSPASALVNLSQTALVAYPVMGAKWGYDKSAAALLTASKEAAKGKNDITGSLNAEERAAYDEAVRAGTIDVTMAHDLAGIAQGEDSKVMWKIRPVMRWASYMFHHAERFNRQVTFIAAFRLARQAGADAAAAFEQATDATYKGHFDYSAGNRPRVMQGNVAKVLLLFKQYGQNMIYTLARSAEQSIRGETPEARKEARRTLSGLLVMHGLAAGGLGLPMVTTLLAAASMIGGDEDEPWDAKVALQNVLADSLGQKPAEVLMHGVSRLTPWDISGRVGLDKLLLPDVQEGLEGQRLWESTATAALGPVASIFGGVLKGGQTMAGGDWLRGLEEMLPAVVRNGAKSLRYANEGAQDKTGVAILDELNPAEIAGQALGFSPSRVRNAYEGKGAVLGLDGELSRRRSSLTKRFAMAQMAGDLEGAREVRQAVQRFNEKNPARKITPMNLAQSVRARQRRIDQAQDGVYLTKSRQDARAAGRFAEVE